MTVQRILKSKGDAKVITIKPDAGVNDALLLLAKHAIGTVVISEDGIAVAGILSERDVVRAIAKDGAAVLEKKVSALMTKNVESTTRTEDADLVLARMTKGRFRHMPVIEDGKLIGLITIGDVVKARLSEVAMEKEALQGMIMGY